MYCVIIVMSISLAFSEGKPCCNKKAGKNIVSCKFNHADIGENKNISEKITDKDTEGNLNAQKCNIADVCNCAKSTIKPWWKFWSKKSTNNCPCKQANATEASVSKKSTITVLN